MTSLMFFGYNLFVLLFFFMLILHNKVTKIFRSVVGHA